MVVVQSAGKHIYLCWKRPLDALGPPLDLLLLAGLLLESRLFDLRTWTSTYVDFSGHRTLKTLRVKLTPKSSTRRRAATRTAKGSSAIPVLFSIHLSSKH